MNRIALTLLALLFAANFARAAFVETVRGKLDRGSGGELVLTLPFAPSQLARLADKEGREKDFDTVALSELVRERFHYLLRLRVADRELSPTAVRVMESSDAFLLIATWAEVGNERAQVFTQADSKDYRVELALTDVRPAIETRNAHADLPTKTSAASEAADFVRTIPGGIVLFLLILGICLLARRSRARLFGRKASSRSFSS